MRTYHIALIAALIAGGILPDVVRSEDRTLEQRVSELEQRLPPSAADSKSATVEAGDNGFLLHSPDNAYQFRLSAYLQADERTFLGDDQPAATNTFFLRRVRPIIQGTVDKYHTFSFVPDFGQGATVLQDAYYENIYIAQAKLRAGKFKTPFGLERLETDANTHFVELALPSSLTPNRDVGAQVSGPLANGSVSYAVGVFNGNPDNTVTDADTNDSKDVAGRVFFTHQGLGAGLGATYGTEAGSLPTFKTTGGQTIFSYATGSAADGERFCISPQGDYYRGPFGLLAEYIESGQVIKKGSADNRIRHSAWQTAASVILTGEKNSYADGVAPQHAFDPRNGGWGAWELAARYSELDFDDDVLTLGLANNASSVSRAQAWAIGINWYLTRHVKYVLNFERTTFTGGAAGGTDREPENVLVARIQFFI